MTTFAQGDSITVHPGPEDFAIDSFTYPGFPRLIVSCADRQNWDGGWFDMIDLEKDDVVPMSVTGLGDSITLNPHGCDLRKIDGKVYYYVVNHMIKDKNGSKKTCEWDEEQQVLKFLVQKNNLRLMQVFRSDSLLLGPNDIKVCKDGSFYVSNFIGGSDCKIRRRALLGKKRTGSIVHCDKDGNWTATIKRLRAPNGIEVSEDEKTIYFTTTRGNTVMSYLLPTPEKYSKLTKLAHVKGADNLIWEDETHLLTTSHRNSIRMVRHFKKPYKRSSPSVVWRIDVSAGKPNKEKVYKDGGKAISAASTALMYGGKLYMAQVMRRYVLVVPQ